MNRERKRGKKTPSPVHTFRLTRPSNWDEKRFLKRGKKERNKNRSCSISPCCAREELQEKGIARQLSDSDIQKEERKRGTRRSTPSPAISVSLLGQGGEQRGGEPYFNKKESEQLTRRGRAHLFSSALWEKLQVRAVYR